MLLTLTELSKIKALISNGGIIAYPTEGVYGLGCDPFNQSAVARLNQLKNRPQNKPFLLIAADWSSIEPLITTLTAQQYQQITASWPGPTTWLLPASDITPSWLTNQQHKIAIRLTNHTLAKTLCEYLKQPLISTSANLAEQPPAITAAEVKKSFADNLDYVVVGTVDQPGKTSTIKDLLTGKIIRE